MLSWPSSIGPEVVTFLIDLLALKTALMKWAFLWCEPIQRKEQDDTPRAQSADPTTINAADGAQTPQEEGRV